MAKVSKDYASIPSIAADVEHRADHQRSATSIYHSSLRTLIWATAAVVGLTLLICSMAHDCGIWQSSQTNMPMNETHSYVMEGRAKYDDDSDMMSNDESSPVPVPGGPGGPPPPLPPKRFSEARHGHKNHNHVKSHHHDKPHHHHHRPPPHHHHHSKQAHSEDEHSESDDEKGWMSSLHAWWNNMADKVDEEVHEKEDESKDKQDEQNENSSDEMKIGNMTEGEESVVVVKHAANADMNGPNNMTTDENDDN
ncbi:hypothetical protein FisN_8Lh033 [Fistulifera solaris]|uniref:Uncharacterized protein n=1 Tax=Fistulifera solaris TaxID=1519565 RepID=A0A1Z5JD68_FISSO|nr:hypothetical protein FisN_8Lh033 [Fistulifera solaris]|eukprot:GAX11945.1 hypothetical protein FisN_8Lh033 [Fistulifera solaris]